MNLAFQIETRMEFLRYIKHIIQKEAAGKIILSRDK